MSKNLESFYKQEKALCNVLKERLSKYNLELRYYVLANDRLQKENEWLREELNKLKETRLDTLYDIENQIRMEMKFND